jgi:3-hydroxybutyryl-CoA dehydratase
LSRSLKCNDSYEESKSFSEKEIDDFSKLTGDTNKIHLDDHYAQEKGFIGRICHGMLATSYISKILAVNFPGQGSIYLNQFVSFIAPVYPNKELIYRLTIKEAELEKQKYLIQTEVIQAEDNKLLVSGEALVLVR